jgi:hypothetical protein
MIVIRSARNARAVGQSFWRFDGDSEKIEGKPVYFERCDVAAGSQRLRDPVAKQTHTQAVPGENTNAQKKQNGENNDLPALHAIRPAHYFDSGNSQLQIAL